MFYGAQIKPGVTVTPSAEDGGEILHLSQICLVDAKDDARTFVQVNDGEKTYSIAVLQKDKCEQVSVDLFISTVSGVKLSTKGGKNEVHIVGYFEPESQDVDFDGEDSESDTSLMNQFSNNGKIEDLDELNEAEDESDDEETAKPTKGKQVKNIKENNKKGKEKIKEKNEENEDEELEEEEDELEEEEDDDDEEYDEEDIEDDDDDDDDEDVPQLTNGVKHDEKAKGNKKEKKTQNTVSTNKQSNASAEQQKRKNDNKIENDSKKQKVENKKGGEGNSEIENFEKELKKYLTANGRTSLGILGQKVKKPVSIEKLGQFIKEHASFKLENGFVSLVK